MDHNDAPGEEHQERTRARLRRAGGASRYSLPTTVSISGGSPSLRRSRATVTETMLLNGSRWAFHTCSSSSSALTTRPSAASSSSRMPNSLRVGDSAWVPRLARCRARSTVRSPRHTIGGADGARRPSAHPRDQLVEGERLGQVVVGAELQPIDPVIDARGRGEHQDPGAAPGERAADLVAVHHRQVPVEHDHVVGGEAGLGQGGRAVVGDVHRQAGVAQSLGDLPGQRDVVFGHQHPHHTIVPGRT
jgi:hypothetical protein